MESLVEIIAAKRDGEELSPSQIKRIIQSFAGDNIPGEQFADYQMAAFLMAVFLRGMTDTETVALTEAMLESGQVLDLSSIPGIKIDKHSTGGVGDKVSIALVPILGACGVKVPMISGRGLGHTGGTLDKLEAIPGFNTSIKTDTFTHIVRDLGACMIGQTAEIAPADKLMYALRDVTATVESIPLIVASILSKKLAEGIDALVLDVKVGKGAFMKNLEAARKLASALVRVGTQAGRKVVAVLTRMDAPLGRTIGNALETREAIDILFGRAPEDVTECTYALCAEMLVLARAASNEAEAMGLIDKVIRNGGAADFMMRMVGAQFGDSSVVRNPDIMGIAPFVIPIRASRAGYVTGIDALELGMSAVALGAGRTRADQKVDPLVGIVLDTHIGHWIEKDAPVAHVHARSEMQAGQVIDRIRGAFEIGDACESRKPLVIERITIDDCV
ncbi:MAG: thymidine phosphorylase [Polyangiaceae bacterium]|nr:thymidine phosphorylase [Polyangiaceae bacterium]